MCHQLKTLVALFFISMVACDTCNYTKFTPDHVGCKTMNPSCVIADNHMTYADKEYILTLHNAFRRRVALGMMVFGEVPAPASNMLELEWDDELAFLAQRHAETCNDEYDCDDCRKVDRFNVGQYIYTTYSPNFPRPWERMMTSYYEAAEYNQLIWADTWRLGCGKVVFEDDSSKRYKALIICNYGPGANLHSRAPPYRTGVAGSACGTGSCIGDSCNGTGVAATYEELCKKIPPSTPVSNTE